jgi:hypothetical protein
VRGVTEIRFKLRDGDLDWREVDGDVVVLDLRESRYLAINRTGLVLWSALAAGATRDELPNRLVEACGIDRAQAASDVDAFTAELESRDLLLHE